MGAFAAPVAVASDLTSPVRRRIHVSLFSLRGGTQVRERRRVRRARGKRVVGCFTYRGGRMYHGRTMEEEWGPLVIVIIYEDHGQGLYLIGGETGEG